MKIDETNCASTPDSTIAQIIQMKTIFDRVLNRDIPSIFDPDCEGH